MVTKLNFFRIKNTTCLHQQTRINVIMILFHENDV